MILQRRNKTEINYLVYEVTERCNLDCSFCYNHWKRDTDTRELAVEGYRSSLKTLQQLFKIAKIKHITFTGGEPLLAERIGELVLYCRMRGVSVSLISNGNAGGEDDYAQLIRLGVQLFELPVHSADATIHDRMTCVPGSWERSISTIQLIKRMKGIIVPVLVLTKHNFHDVGRTFEFIHSMGFKRIMLNRYNIGGKGISFPDKVSATLEELNEAFSQANRLARELNLTVSSNVCTPHCVVYPALYRNIQFTNCSLDVLHRPLTLTVAGNLRFCNHSPSILGNIFKDPMADILNNGLITGAIQKRPEICNGCVKYEKCLGGCRAAAEQAGGTFSDVDPIVLLNEEFVNIKSN